MTSVSVGRRGEIALPDEIRDQYGLTPNTPVRIIATRSGILLIPLTNAPMSEELAQELADWQSLSAGTWEMFPYEEPDP